MNHSKAIFDRHRTPKEPLAFSTRSQTESEEIIAGNMREDNFIMFINDTLIKRPKQTIQNIIYNTDVKYLI